MVTYLDVQPTALITAVAQELKNNPTIKLPEWAVFVKTGAHKELPPVQTDWWYTRVAAVLRKVAIMGPVGTNKLKVMYGGRQRRGHKKPVFKTGSGSILRESLQQLETAGLVKHAIIGSHKGRVITPAGHKLLDKMAQQVAAK